MLSLLQMAKIEQSIWPSGHTLHHTDSFFSYVVFVAELDSPQHLKDVASSRLHRQSFWVLLLKRLEVNAMLLNNNYH